MKLIEEVLKPTDGYIKSIIRNSMSGWWELEIGLPKTWVFDENKEVKCEILLENEIGKLIKILPKNHNVVIDDLIKFVEIIIETNQRIAEKEKEFTDRMQEMKSVLENEAKKFYEELDELKINSFKNLNNNFVKTLHTEDDKKSRKPKQNKDSNNSALALSNAQSIEINTEKC
jgi:hypothetical protein